MLDLAIGKCKVALLVVRHSLPLSQNGEHALERLAPFLRQKVESSEWPGTTLLNGVASVYYYDFGVECAEALKEVTDSLYSWEQPNLPEDLCLLRANTEPWLVSISHERDGYVRLSREKTTQVAKVLPALCAIMQREDTK